MIRRDYFNSRIEYRRKIKKIDLLGDEHEYPLCNIEYFVRPDPKAPAYDKGEIPLRMKECGHVFGNKCLGHWVIYEQKNECPTCQSVIVDFSDHPWFDKDFTSEYLSDEDQEAEDEFLQDETNLLSDEEAEREELRQERIATGMISDDDEGMPAQCTILSSLLIPRVTTRREDNPSLHKICLGVVC